MQRQRDDDWRAKLIVLDAPLDGVPHRREQLPKPEGQAFLPVKLELENGGAQRTLVEAVAACQIEVVLLPPADRAEDGRFVRRRLRSVRLESQARGEGQAAARALGSGPGLDAAPAVAAYARPACMGEFAATDPALTGKDHRAQAVRQVAQQRSRKYLMAWAGVNERKIGR